MTPPDPDRPALEAAWLHLTRTELPALAAHRRWPVHADHCFQRILLDHALGGAWHVHVRRRPAYRHIATDRLAIAITLGRAAIAGHVDLVMLNRRSLAWRRALPDPPPLSQLSLFDATPPACLVEGGAIDIGDVRPGPGTQRHRRDDP